jgi:hypothetical protein
MKARDNPFRTERVDALRYRSRDFSWDDLESRLEANRWRGAIVGPEGHGKTTLLAEWAERRRRAGDLVVQCRIASGQRRLAEPQRGMLKAKAWIFVDSAEQLGWLGWQELRWLTSNACALVVATHRPGRLATVHACHTSPALLAELVAELDSGLQDWDALWTRHRGNVRMALRELYDRCALKTETAECV